ncbi:MAG: Asp-tRNA(Asn)/Glu-tRNA(Gln) amidotransferase subunit GatC [Patescibacteria group bacterium]
MKLSQKDVEHIAKLAAIDLTADEKKKFAKQLSAILDYVEQLKEVDTSKVAPTFQVTGLEDVSRADESATKDPLVSQSIKDNWPEHQDNLIKVRGVFEGEE